MGGKEVEGSPSFLIFLATSPVGCGCFFDRRLSSTFINVFNSSQYNNQCRVILLITYYLNAMGFYVLLYHRDYLGHQILL